MPTRAFHEAGVAEHGTEGLEASYGRGEVVVSIGAGIDALGVVGRSGNASLGENTCIRIAYEGGHTPVLAAGLGFHDGNIHVLSNALVASGEKCAHGGHGADGPRLIEAHLATQLHWLAVWEAGAEHLAAHAIENDF